MGTEHETAVHILAQLMNTKLNYNTPGGIYEQVEQATGVSIQMLEALAAQANDPDILTLIQYIKQGK